MSATPRGAGILSSATAEKSSSPAKSRGKEETVRLPSWTPMGRRPERLPWTPIPNLFQLEKTGTRVFVNVPDHQEVEVADLAKGTVLARWPVTACTTNF